MTSIRTIDPSTGHEIAAFEEDSFEFIESRLGAAEAAVRQLAELSWDERSCRLRAAADLLESEIDEVAALITLEMGKPICQARAEVSKSAYGMRYYADQAEEFLTGRKLENPSVVSASAAYTRFDPLGVVFAVMPWNYPVWQVVRFAAPALMAGNAGLLKHASNVPQTAMYIGELFTRAGFPRGAFSTLLMSSSGVEAVIRDRRVAAITLTGSEGAGRAVASAAGDVLKKVVLELGGSDPFIVMPSAHLEAAVQMAVTARTANSGQACINAKRFIVHTDIYDAFARLFAQQMDALVVGDPALASTEVGPLATEAGRADLEELVEDARVKGATILTGGRRGDVGTGWYYEPTVIADITPEMRLHQEEAFGPVASLYRVSSFEEAVDTANDSPFGLSSAFWSNDAGEIAHAERALHSGAVFINGMTISYPELPFGGVKRSGYGRELSREGIREFSNLKTVWVA